MDRAASTSIFSTSMLVWPKRAIQDGSVLMGTETVRLAPWRGLLAVNCGIACMETPPSLWMRANVTRPAFVPTPSAVCTSLPRLALMFRLLRSLRLT